MALWDCEHHKWSVLAQCSVSLSIAHSLFLFKVNRTFFTYFSGHIDAFSGQLYTSHSLQRTAFNIPLLQFKSYSYFLEMLFRELLEPQNQCTGIPISPYLCQSGLVDSLSVLFTLCLNRFVS